MSELLIVCPNCNSAMQKNTLECVGMDEIDFVPKSSGFKLGINIKLGSFSFGNDEVLHGLLTDIYLCAECKKIFAIYNIGE